jgi:proline racemase
MQGGAVQSVGFRNVPSYVLGRDVRLELESGSVQVDVAYGGAIYASVPASTFGLTVTPDCYADLIRVGREVKWALDATAWSQHPDDPRLSGVYGTILFDDLGDTADGPHQRNVTVFADGEVDRSPCGSGTSARVALLADEGRLGPSQTLLHESIVGTRFTAQVVERDAAAGRAVFVPEVTGMAYRTGEHRFVLDPRDPVDRGFVLR